MGIKLTDLQITQLASPFVKRLDEIIDFYKDPKNEQGYREWYFEKYGCYPDPLEF